MFGPEAPSTVAWLDTGDKCNDFTYKMKLLSVVNNEALMSWRRRTDSAGLFRRFTDNI